MKQNYNEEKHEIGLKNSIPDKEIDIIDKVQFEFVRDMMKLKKSVRLPNFGIFTLKGKYSNG